ncbi:type II toxin-antitoxin system PemK/MazF family toxin [Xanthomonas translucens pv. graminis]|uniref:type II toxin-antitoxin system PemK/MazF family toxin n=1 Tax=Xanthomonas graminis TaxID=3390026 RepID=UPI002541469E|nr:type II toxin-antitoxin system PemK/MazF family toxin [Xanthomonas translucens]WIH05508.1 type II toxin-antitoxin system PemK/MazF family toxin [Xanthomonas translucens pv. graminis]
MGLKFHPDPGVVVICDFSGFKEPEMVKRRPAIVISPRFRQRDDLCTIVPLSTTPPRSVCKFHHRIQFDPRMPDPYGEEWMWVKADMVSAVSFARLTLPWEGRDLQGNRVYDVRKISDVDLKAIKACVLHALGMGHLTPHL